METDLSKVSKDFEYLTPDDLGAEALLPRSDPLDRRISSQAWNIFCWDLKPISPEVLERLPPTSARSFYIFIRMSYLAPMRGSFMDKDFDAAAKKTGKSIVYLETVADAVGAMKALMGEVVHIDAAGLEQFLTRDPLAAVKQGIAARYRQELAYKRGDLKALGDEVAAPTTYEGLIGQRNRSWIDKIDSALIDGGAFVAVGAAHYTGPASLLTLLEARGYSLKRWPF
jgi:uncharacterized protein YbaP (TraB family)